jgi:uncharacterized protein YjbI with pentapeptide repeats
MTSQPNTTDNNIPVNQPEATTLLTAAQLLERYAAGERRFRQIQLKKADLNRANLALIDLRGADLSYANLREADLSSADLRGACLDGVDFYKANLSRTNFEGASLEKTNLKEANLLRASFKKASLEGAFLTKAQMSRVDLKEACLLSAHLNDADLSNADLSNADLSNAYLIGTNLQRANLSEVNIAGTFLSGAVVKGANFSGGYYNEKTNFDASFDPVGAGLRKAQTATIDEALIAFRHVSECASRYMGPKMTARNLETSRPDFEWLQEFNIGSSGQVTFSGNATEPLTVAKIKHCSQWLEGFISSCSAIVQEFPTLIDRDKLGLFDPKIEDFI